MPEDPVEVASLELMRRVADRLPEGSFERLQLQDAVAGLSTIDVFGTLAPRETHYQARAREVLKVVLPKIAVLLPDDAEVRELLMRYC